MNFENIATGFNLGIENNPPMSTGWREVANGRTIVKAAFLDFGFADQCTAYFEFSDGTFEVGIGEALRPYDQLYSGNDGNDAKAAFMSKLLTMTEYEEANS